jgi:hypothetical protein
MVFPVRLLTGGGTVPGSLAATASKKAKTTGCGDARAVSVFVGRVGYDGEEVGDYECVGSIFMGIEWRGTGMLSS